MGVMDDPYPYYTALRDHAPVHHSSQLGMYVLSRYEDVLRAVRDIARFARGRQGPAYDGNTPAMRVIFANNLNSRFRRVCSGGF